MDSTQSTAPCQGPTIFTSHYSQVTARSCPASLPSEAVRYSSEIFKSLISTDTILQSTTLHSFFSFNPGKTRQPACSTHLTSLLKHPIHQLRPSKPLITHHSSTVISQFLIPYFSPTHQRETSPFSPPSFQTRHHHG
ncbi:hypothetical protein EYC84_005935 [Monilinia fructicola]|uniref:Uncharacterized protein n=1 Tax=Monilinia fructicola TaxID=38448 RepID=A0A5M9K2W4_MONFR|nr:hypothetical protein EYC84_005935 [Monilinia fructicola]